MMKPLLLILASLISINVPAFTPPDSTKDLSRTFARGYLFGSGGLNSSTTILVATNDTPYGAHNPILFGGTFHAGYGRNITGNLYAEFGVAVMTLKNSFYVRMSPAYRTSPYGKKLGLQTYDWRYDLRTIYYYPLLGKNLFLSGSLALNLTKIRTNLYTFDDLKYSKVNGWNKNKYSLGGTAGLGLNVKLGKRLLIYGSYRFQYLFTNDAFTHFRISYYGDIGNILQYYETKSAPYSQYIELGLKISLEN